MEKNKMGHDISAIKDYNEHQRFWNSKDCLKGNNSKVHEEKNDIAYLRRNMSSETIHELYEFLDCSGADNGVSGSGAFVIVDLETIKEAIEKVVNEDFDLEDEHDYVKFLVKLVDYCENNNEEGVIINFA